MTGTLLGRGAVQAEFRTVKDLRSHRRRGRARGTKAVAPLGREQVSIPIPAGVDQVSLLGEVLEAMTSAGKEVATPGRPVAIISNVQIGACRRSRAARAQFVPPHLCRARITFISSARSASAHARAGRRARAAPSRPPRARVLRQRVDQVLVGHRRRHLRIEPAARGLSTSSASSRRRARRISSRSSSACLPLPCCRRAPAGRAE